MEFNTSIRNIDGDGTILFANGRVGRAYRFSAPSVIQCSEDDARLAGAMTALAFEACPDLCVATYHIRIPHCPDLDASREGSIDYCRREVLQSMECYRWHTFLVFFTKKKYKPELSGFSDFISALMGKEVHDSSAAGAHFRELVETYLSPQASAFTSQLSGLIKTTPLSCDETFGLFTSIANASGESLRSAPNVRSIERPGGLIHLDVVTDTGSGHITYTGDGCSRRGAISTARAINVEYLPLSLAGIFKTSACDYVCLSFMWSPYSDSERSAFFSNQTRRIDDMDQSFTKLIQKRPQSPDKSMNYSGWLRDEVDELQKNKRQTTLWGDMSVSILMADSAPTRLTSAISDANALFRAKNISVATETRGVSCALSALFPGSCELGVRRIPVPAAGGGVTAPWYSDDHGVDGAAITLRSRYGTLYGFERIINGLGGVICIGVTGSGKSVFANCFGGYVAEQGQTIMLSYDYGNRGILDKFESSLFEFPANPIDLFGSRQQAHITDTMLSLAPTANDEEKAAIKEAVAECFSLPGEDPSFEFFCLNLPNSIVKKHFSDWKEGGPYAGAISAGAGDSIGFDKPVTLLDLQSLAHSDVVRDVVLNEMCYRVLQLFTSLDNANTNKMLEVDEAHFALKHKSLARLLETIARTARKTNAGVAAFTQKVAELVGYDGWAPFRDACSTWVFGSDMEAGSQYVEAFPSLTEHDTEIIRSLRPRREFLIVQPHRQAKQIVSLDLDPHTLAWASTDKDVRPRCAQLIQERGRVFGLKAMASELTQ